MFIELNGHALKVRQSHGLRSEHYLEFVLLDQRGVDGSSIPTRKRLGEIQILEMVNILRSSFIIGFLVPLPLEVIFV